MNERQMQFRVGVVVFATMIIGGLLATLSGPLTTSWLPWGRRSYNVGIKVDKAPGVDHNTPVRKNGISIGRVKSIEEQTGGMLLKAEIDSAIGRSTPSIEPHIRTTVHWRCDNRFSSNSAASSGSSTCGGRHDISAGMSTRIRLIRLVNWAI